MNTTNPSSCGFTGDAENYGLGVRLGMYLQWIATFLATTLELPTAPSIRTANTTFQLANFAGLLLLTFHRPQVYAVEPLLIPSILFGAAWLFILIAINVEGSVDEAILRILLYTTAVGYTTWYFWHGMDTMIQPSCGSFAYFFCKVNLFGFFRAVGKVFTVWASIAFALLWIFHVPDLFWARFPVLNKVKKRVVPGRASFEDEEPLNQKDIFGGEFGTVLVTVLGLVVLIFMIIGAELVIVWNNIQGVYALDSTGQFIPAFLGLVLLGTTLVEAIRGKREKDRRDEQERKKVGIVYKSKQS